MPDTYEIKDPQTGTIYEIRADKMPSNGQIQGALAMYRAKGGQPPPPAQPPQQAGMSQEEWAALPVGEKVRNVLKWGTAATMNLFAPGQGGQMAKDAEEHPALTAASVFVPAAAEAAAPALRAVVPSMARAGAKFQSVMGAAKDVPVELKASGDQALRIFDLSKRGGTLPKVVNDLLRRVTDPAKGPMVYEEARDFASNISRLSADEMNRLPAAMKREIGNLRVLFNSDVERAAAQAGKLEEYQSAMREYRRAAQLKDAGAEVVKGAKKAVPYATGAGLGYYGVKSIGHLLSGSD